MRYKKIAVSESNMKDFMIVRRNMHVSAFGIDKYLKEGVKDSVDFKLSSSSDKLMLFKDKLICIEVGVAVTTAFWQAKLEIKYDRNVNNRGNILLFFTFCIFCFSLFLLKFEFF